jgi:hypothetical protein
MQWQNVRIGHRTPNDDPAGTKAVVIAGLDAGWAGRPMQVFHFLCMSTIAAFPMPKKIGIKLQ